jgi:carboxylesterase type B
MIFRESGGGAKTSCLYAMPSAAPYFNKASVESGTGIRMMPRDAAAETTLKGAMAWAYPQLEVAVESTRGRSRSAFLASRENASELIDLLLVQKGVCAEAGIATGEVYSIE